MEITISKTELVRGLNAIKGAINKDAALDILQNVKLYASGDTLTLAATDLGIGIIQDLEANIKKAGGVCLPAKQLLDMAKSAPKDEIKITVDNQLKAIVKSGKTEYKLAGISDTDFPVLNRPSTDSLKPINPVALSTLIGKTSFAISEDEARSYLNGVFLKSDKQLTTLAATDGHRCARAVLNADDTSMPQLAGVIIPRRGLLEMRRFLDDHKQEAKLSWQGSNLYLASEKSSLAVKLLDAQFPDYEQILPKALSQHRATVARIELLDALKRIALLANDEHRTVAMSFEKGKLTIECKQGQSEAREELDVTFIGKPLKIGMNARYLQDAISATSALEIMMHTQDEISPVNVEVPNDSTYICVIMPVRL